MASPSCSPNCTPTITLTATIVTEHPPKVVTQRQVDASLASGQPPAMANTGHTPGAAPAAASGGMSADSGAGHQLPKTASSLPLVALLGGVFLAIGAGMTLLRRRLA